MTIFYAGIGSRKTPLKLKQTIINIAKFLESKEFILRSGGADGADSFFEEGVTNFLNKEIFLPWKGFNNNSSDIYTIHSECFNIAEILVEENDNITWKYLKPAVKRLFARSIHQILGSNPEEQSNWSKFVICWTDKGKFTGGTRIGLYCAKKYNIPIINLYESNWKNQLKEIINGI